MSCAFLSGKANAAFCPNLADHEGGRMHFGGLHFRKLGEFLGWVCVWGERGGHEWAPKLPKDTAAPWEMLPCGGKDLGQLVNPSSWIKVVPGFRKPHGHAPSFGQVNESCLKL